MWAAPWLVPLLCGATPREVILSPSGSDAHGQGTAAAPFATLARALAASRSRSAKTITFLNGTYRLAAPVDLGADDAGLLLRAAHPGGAVLSGGVPLTNWTQAPGAPTLWRAPLAVPQGHAPLLRQLYVEGVRAARPSCVLRGPVNATRDADVAVLGPDRPKDAALVGYVSVDPLVRDWTQAMGVEGIYNGTAQEWTEHRCTVARVVAINASASLLVIAQPCFTIAMVRSGWTAEGGGAGVGVPHYWESCGAPREPQQWRQLPAAGGAARVELMLGPERPPSQAVAPLVDGPLLRMSGADHVTVDGLGFEHATWLQPSGGLGYVQVRAHRFEPQAARRLARGCREPRNERLALHIGARRQRVCPTPGRRRPRPGSRARGRRARRGPYRAGLQTATPRPTTQPT